MAIPAHRMEPLWHATTFDNLHPVKQVARDAAGLRMYMHTGQQQQHAH